MKKTDKLIRTPRIRHKGSVLVRNDGGRPSWVGRWCVYIEQKDGTYISRRKRAFLGYVDEMGREQALQEFQRKKTASQAKYEMLQAAAHNKNAKWFIDEPLVRGAAGELVAAVDLLRHGFQVFQNVNATGTCDLIAETPIVHKLLRVEVKTGTLRLDGSPRVEVATKRGKFDLLVVVLPDLKCAYFDSALTPLGNLDAPLLPTEATAASENGHV